MRDAYRRLRERAAGPHIAAAVCFRGHDERLQYRLVRTSDGARWTFPKGRREPGETLAETAAREAAEEAGVAGVVVGDKRLTEYRHAPSRREGRADDLVAAFLLAVQSAGPSSEGGRDATCSTRRPRARNWPKAAMHSTLGNCSACSTPPRTSCAVADERSTATAAEM